MALLPLALLLLAAVMHASWNLLVKRATERQVFTWWALCVGALCCLPLLLVGGALPTAVLPFVAASALAEAAYFLALTRAYQVADFSLAYPMARGAAPVFLLVWSVLLLGDRPRPGGYAGLALLVGGLALVGSAAWLARRSSHPSAPSSRGLLMALGVALCISIYTAIDGKAVHLPSTSPVGYTVAVMACTAVVLGPPLLAFYGRRTLATELRVNWPRIAVVGVLNIATYILVLLAYQMSRVSYAGAIREVSVVFGALLGWLVLGERFGLPRLAGAALIFAGIVVIAVAG
jgi:drug/metabolite transporter (DMT)-like permease